MDNFFENSEILTNSGVVALSDYHGRSLDVTNLDRQTALYIALRLTLELDAMYQEIDENYPGMFLDGKPWDFKEVQELSNLTDLKTEGADIFGEVRPANGYCAVLVQPWGDCYRLLANNANDFSDDPEPDAGRFLQAGFIAVLDSIDLGNRETWY